MASNPASPQAVEAALRELPDLETGQSLVEAGQVGGIQVDGNRASLTLKLTPFVGPLWDEIREAAAQVVRERVPELQEVDVAIAPLDRPAEKMEPLGLTVKSVVAVGSGKGGVGKSTIAATVAYGLKRAGCKVGLMDADVYGPSIPHLLGIDQKPEAINRRLQPIERDGLRVMSMGLLVPPGEAVVWRGPMLHGAITQFLRDTDWGQLDYLIIDLPPGTGDVSLTLSQLLPLSGAVVVCTPQDVALLDAIKAIAMFRKVNIPILGLVENMSYFTCPNCSERHEIFGSGGARQRAEQQEVPFLGEVPINMQIRIRGDQGTTGGNFDDAASEPYLTAICRGLVRNVLARKTETAELPSL
ncbi:MAG: Mrp/NBP35 family ATP-binding protein [Pirellulales bacterium]